MKKPIEFHANGKLLITGEYLVLAGARALALPVRFGQKMVIHESKTGMIDWASSAPGGTWFTVQFEPESLHIISAGNLKIAERLKKLLSAARGLNPAFLTDSGGYDVHVKADYPPEWGLGSSSTLCSLIADWASADPYQLYRLISNGSGYDVACATRKEIIYYTLAGQEGPLKGSGTTSGWVQQIIPTSAGVALREYTYFVYLGNKQDTDREIEAFLSGKTWTEAEVQHVSILSTLICEAGTHEELISLVDEHESMMAEILDRQVIASRFPGFPGTVKSLGAWGGDFAMFISGRDPTEVIGLLNGYGFSDIFRFNEIEATE